MKHEGEEEEGVEPRLSDLQGMSQSETCNKHTSIQNKKDCT